MLDNCTIEERWTGVNDLIERWLQARQGVIVQFCSISGVNEYRSDSQAPESKVETFCQLLVDYLSTGHFEVYYELVREAEAFADGSAELAKSMIPQLATTTDQAMAFYDKYADSANYTLLPQHLSQLGEILEARFELEDQLIDTLHEAHREMVA